MAEWLIFLLVFLGLGCTHYAGYRWGQWRGYEAGYNDSLRECRELDELLRWPPRRPIS